MAAPALTVFGWQARRLARRAGWPAWVAAVLLAAAAVLHAQAAAYRAESGALRAEAARLAARPGAPEAAAADGNAARLAAFYERLPRQSEIAPQLKRLFAVADQNDIQLAQGEYRPQADREARVIRYGITLPVRGEARAIQSFILGALAEAPALGLEGVSFRRESERSGEIEARVRFVLIAKGEE